MTNSKNNSSIVSNDLSSAEDSSTQPPSLKSSPSDTITNDSNATKHETTQPLGSTSLGSAVDRLATHVNKNDSDITTNDSSATTDEAKHPSALTNLTSELINAIAIRR